MDCGLFGISNIGYQLQDIINLIQLLITQTSVKHQDRNLVNTLLNHSLVALHVLTTN
jgi:hypothetical protein